MLLWWPPLLKPFAKHSIFLQKVRLFFEFPSQNIQYFFKNSAFFSNFLHKTFNILVFMSRFFPFPSQNIQYFLENVTCSFFSFTKCSIFSARYLLFWQNPSQNMKYFVWTCQLFLHKTFNIFPSFFGVRRRLSDHFLKNPSQNVQYFSKFVTIFPKTFTFYSIFVNFFNFFIFFQKNLPISFNIFRKLFIFYRFAKFPSHFIQFFFKTCQLFLHKTFNICPSFFGVKLCNCYSS